MYLIADNCVHCRLRWIFRKMWSCAGVEIAVTSGWRYRSAQLFSHQECPVEFWNTSPENGHYFRRSGEAILLYPAVPRRRRSGNTSFVRVNIYATVYGDGCVHMFCSLNVSIREWHCYIVFVRVVGVAILGTKAQLFWEKSDWQLVRLMYFGSIGDFIALTVGWWHFWHLYR